MEGRGVAATEGAERVGQRFEQILVLVVGPHSHDFPLRDEDFGLDQALVDESVLEGGRLDADADDGTPTCFLGCGAPISYQIILHPSVRDPSCMH